MRWIIKFYQPDDAPAPAPPEPPKPRWTIEIRATAQATANNSASVTVPNPVAELGNVQGIAVERKVQVSASVRNSSGGDVTITNTTENRTLERATARSGAQATANFLAYERRKNSIGDTIKTSSSGGGEVTTTVESSIRIGGGRRLVPILPT